MFRSIPLGRLLGIPLYIHPTFLLLPAWVLYFTLFLQHGSPAIALFSLALVLAIFGCVILHELGHAMMARHYGIGTRDITLYPIGGVARLQGMSQQPGREIAIALAGPAVNFAIAVLLTPFALLRLFAVPLLGWEIGGGSVFVALLHFLTLLWVGNIGLLLFNLVPCFPMDGGRVLRALLALRFGLLRATEVAATIGLGVAVLIAGLSVLAGNPMTIILAGFVALAGQAELRALREVLTRREAAAPALPSAPQPVAEAIVLRPDGPPPQELTATFSGVTWDRERGVWVVWRNGLPIAFWTGAQ
jgi:Zn-dependent protease